VNTPIYPGFTTYATENGQRYRLFGLVRGNVTDSDAANMLAAMGLASVTFYPQGSHLPSDWPKDEPTLQPSSDERFFRAEGTWSKNEPMPTAASTNAGAVIIYALWQYTAEAKPISGPVAPSYTMTFIAVGAVLIAGGVALAYWQTRKQHGFAENPRRYDSTIEHMGVPIHIHVDADTEDHGDETVCADYRAIERILPGTGGEVCGRSRDYVIAEAKRRVEVLYVRAQHKAGLLKPSKRPSRPPIPSPWD
jgi:hypothetical protein